MVLRKMIKNLFSTLVCVGLGCQNDIITYFSAIVGSTQYNVDAAAIAYNVGWDQNDTLMLSFAEAYTKVIVNKMVVYFEPYNIATLEDMKGCNPDKDAEAITDFGCEMYFYCVTSYTVVSIPSCLVFNWTSKVIILLLLGV